jgi:hypothetical protein
VVFLCKSKDDLTPFLTEQNWASCMLSFQIDMGVGSGVEPSHGRSLFRHHVDTHERPNGGATFK